MKRISRDQHLIVEHMLQLTVGQKRKNSQAKQLKREKKNIGNSSMKNHMNKLELNQLFL